MNKQRRQSLSQIMDSIEAVNVLIDNAKNEVESIRDALEAERDNEQEALDNLPEGLQQGERGQDMEAAIEQLDNALNSITELHDALDQFDLLETIGSIDEARGQA